MPNRMQITHKQASDLLLDLVKTINTDNPVYQAEITIYAPKTDEDANIIDYTLLLESKTHFCIEVESMRSNFQEEQFMTQCRELIHEMASNLVQSTADASVLN